MAFRFVDAAEFIYRHARLLERLLFDVNFHSGDPGSVGRQVAAYQNPDGGLGNALEPDIRCRESQPVAVEVGLLALRDANHKDHRLALSLCGFLEHIAVDSGLVHIILPSALDGPHAPHWRSVGEPELNPTAGICGLLHWQGIEHPWLSRATDACCDLLRKNPPEDAHALLRATRLVEYMPDRSVADGMADRIAVALPSASFFIPFAGPGTYGLTPLDFAPSPTSRWRSLFSDAQIKGHLDFLESMQQEDGGWPITWEPPSPMATSEWRGRWSLKAVLSLVAYGRGPNL
jgi:hypothetical protein